VTPIQCHIAPTEMSEGVVCHSAVCHHPPAELLDRLQIEIARLNREVLTVLLGRSSLGFQLGDKGHDAACGNVRKEDKAAPPDDFSGSVRDLLRMFLGATLVA
jgi:hypothetical protein